MARTTAKSQASGAEEAHVALLRGINVGGKNKLAMKDLAALFTALGCADVRTYIASGNVLFRATPALARTLPALATKRIAEQFGLDVPVTLRTADELERVVQGNPFPTAGVEPKTLHVLFLADEPSAEAVARLDPNRSPPDAFRVLGREIYLSLPNGAADTKLTNAWFDRALATMGTGRNWQTVQKLLELSRP